MHRFLLAGVLAATSLCWGADTLTQSERDFAMSQLHASRKLFLDSLDGVSDAQWNFKASPERWSIAECAEHITISEDFMFGLIRSSLKGTATPEKELDAAATKAKDEMLVKSVPDRSRKFQAPEPIKPSNRWKTKDEMIAHFKESRDKNIEFIENTQENMRAHFTPHPAAGPLDAYQWTLLMSGHTERHTLQINEVKADPNYPK